MRTCHINDFAEKCNKSYRTIYRAIKGGEIPIVGKNQIVLTDQRTEEYAARCGYKLNLNDFVSETQNTKQTKTQDTKRAPSPTAKQQYKQQMQDDPEHNPYAGRFGLPDDAPPPSALVYVEMYHKTEKLRLDNAKKAGDLVSRVLLERMIAQIDGAFSQIIMDGASTLVAKIYKKALAGKPLGEVQLFYRKEVHKILRPVKPAMKRMLAKEKKLEDQL